MDPFRRLIELIEDWKFLIHRDGIRSALPLVGQEIARLPYRHLRLYILARTLTEPLPDLQSKITIEICPFQSTHLEQVRDIDRPSEALLCEQRMAHKQYGLVALYHGQVAGFAWGCLPMDSELERVHLQLEPGDILFPDAYTAPAFLTNGVQTALTLARFRLFHDLGFKRAISYIEIHNGPSLAVWRRKFNAHVIGEINFLRVGPWYRVRIHWGQPSSGLGDRVTQASKPNPGQ